MPLTRSWEQTPSLTISNVTDDQVIYANFEINEYTVTFTATVGGSLSGNNRQTLSHGDDCTPVKAVADANYQFTGWTRDYTGGDNPLIITNVQADMIIEAIFSNNTRMVSFVANNGGTISGESNQTINQGASTRQVTAVPDTGYHFLSWTDASDTVLGTNPFLTISNVTDDQVIYANFEITTYTVSFTASDGGSVSGNTRQTCCMEKIAHQ
jgi:hypothetical protein